jgi:putative tricarboxylic transport membrane protein
LNSIIRGTKDFWTGVIYVSIGTAALIINREFAMGSALKMGPAYFPAVLSGILIIIGIISFVRSFIRHGSPVSGYAFKGLLLVTGSTLLFGFIVRGAGLVIALPLLVIISSYASKQFNWKYSLGMAAGLTLFCILIFLKGLGVPLPILGSWFGN